MPRARPRSDRFVVILRKIKLIIVIIKILVDLYHEIF